MFQEFYLGVRWSLIVDTTIEDRNNREVPVSWTVVRTHEGITFTERKGKKSEDDGGEGYSYLLLNPTFRNQTTYPDGYASVCWNLTLGHVLLSQLCLCEVLRKYKTREGGRGTRVKILRKLTGN